MTSGLMRLLLRSVAVLIAIVALIDPVWSIARPPLQRVIAVDLSASTIDDVVRAIQENAPGWEVVRRDVTDRRLPCAPDEQCVVIADGSVDANVPADAGPISVVAILAAAEKNIAIQSVVVSGGHVSAAGSVRVDLSRTGEIGTTRLQIFDGAAVVGSVEHKWSAGSSASVDVPWWPIAAGARTLRVEATPVDGEPTIDNVITAGVSVRVDPVPVLVFDAKPSWASTFVRRALEDDARFAVELRSRIAPSLSAGTRGGQLEADTLEATPVVLVGGPDALTATDVSLLERFVVERGGSLVLLPEQRIDGPIARLMPGAWTEHLVPTPEAVGPLRATEILRTAQPPMGATVLGASGASPSIVSAPAGNGRVIVVGAMDAWRYRHEGAFDRFWHSLISQASMAGAALRIDLQPTIATAGERVPFTIRHHSLEDRSAIEAKVMSQCGSGDRQDVRVWPSGDLNQFDGEIIVADADQCVIEARVGDRTATANIARTDRLQAGVKTTLQKLERDSKASGGAFVSAGDAATLAGTLSASRDGTSRVVSVHPMRTAWWMLPFAGCLSLEWFIRRRAGLR